jgi:hypothetical protein
LVAILKRGGRAARLFAEVLTVALRVEVALRLRSLEDVLTTTDETTQRYLEPPNIHPVTLERAIRATYRVLPLEVTCLKQSLVFCRIRRRWGLPAELRIGVQTTDGTFAAHAWVEDGDGKILTDPLEGFSPLPLPRSASRDARASD